VYDLRDSSPGIDTLADGLNVMHLVAIPRGVSK